MRLSELSRSRPAITLNRQLKTTVFGNTVFLAELGCYLPFSESGHLTYICCYILRLLVEFCPVLTATKTSFN